MSWGDNDTLPLGENDSSLDDIEDIIPTSQPKSLQNTASFELVSNKKIEETVCGDDEFSVIIDDTIPVFGNTTPVLDPSPGYIPDTEARPKRKYNNSELLDVCHKKLLSKTAEVKDSEDIFSTQPFQVPDSPSIIESQLLSVVNETPSQINTTNCVNVMSNNNSSNDVLMSDASITEIFMNDISKEIIDIDSSKSSRIELTDNSMLEIKISSGSCDNMEKKALEDDIMSTDSPLRFTESSATLPVLTGQQWEEELPRLESKDSCRPGTNDTVDANGADFPPFSPFSKRSIEDLATMSTIPLLSGTTSSSTDQELEKKSVGTAKLLQRIFPNESSEVQKHSTPENPSARSLNIDESTSSIENVTPDVVGTSVTHNLAIEFKFKLECVVEFDADYKTITKKTLKRVINLDKPKIVKPPIKLPEPSDSDDKSKNRLSSSSSGSVFSDKANLPFKLPNNRLSAMSSQTESSGSTDELNKHVKILSRTCWMNEYMIPLEMDEALQSHVDGLLNQRNDSTESNKRKTPLSSKKPKSRKKVHQQTLSNVFESTNTEDFLSGPDSHLNEENSEAVNGEKAGSSSNLEKEIHPAENSLKNEEEKKPEENKLKPDEPEAKPDKDAVEKTVKETPEAEQNVMESKPEDEDNFEKNKTPEKKKILNLESFSSGLAVFARWTDQRYYSGVLEEPAKYDRWNVKFDDGTSKAIKEEFIIPTQWLKEGELVFAMAGDKYESGKIKHIDSNSEQFIIELDCTNTDHIVDKSDLCLTEVMASIVKEKYPPLSKATPAPKADIDFDNVVTGKRTREVRTPVRNVSFQLGSTSSKKRSANKSKVNDSGSDTPLTGKVINSTKKTETPTRASKRGRPKAEESNDTEPNIENDTPVRSAGSVKARAKSLIKDLDVSNSSPLPTVPEEPIPGPSGVQKVAKESTPRPTGAKRGRKKKIVEVVQESEPAKEILEEINDPDDQAAVPKSRTGKRKPTDSVDKANEEAPKKSKASKGRSKKR